MTHRTMMIVVLAAAVATFAAATRAQEDENRPEGKIQKVEDRIAEMKKKVRQLSEAGRREEAEKVELQIIKLREQIEKASVKEQEKAEKGEPKKERVEVEVRVKELREGEGPEHAARMAEIRRRVENMHREAAELKQAGRHEEAQRLMAESKELMKSAGAPQLSAKPRIAEGGPIKRIEPRDAEAKHVEARMRHLHEAAAHLREAGMHDLAEKLMRESEQIAHGGPSGPGQGRLAHPGEGHPQPPMEALHRHVEELTRMVHELHAQMAQMREAMEQMRRER